MFEPLYSHELQMIPGSELQAVIDEQVILLF